MGPGLHSAAASGLRSSAVAPGLPSAVAPGSPSAVWLLVLFVLPCGFWFDDSRSAVASGRLRSVAWLLVFVL